MDLGCKWIIGGMAVAIMGMAGYIVKLHRSERSLLLSWLRSLQSQLSMVDLVETGSDTTNPKGGA
jgi:hypothetical protein